MILNFQAPAVWVREAVQLIYALQRQVKKAGSGQALDFVVQPTAVSTIRVPFGRGRGVYSVLYSILLLNTCSNDSYMQCIYTKMFKYYANAGTQGDCF